MNRRQKVVLVVGIILAIAFAGVGLASSSRAPDCAREEQSSVPAPRTGTVIGGRTSFTVCVEDAVHPLNENASRWWYFGAGSVLVLMGVGMIVARPSR